MINYKIGDIDCKIKWEDFLSLIINDEIKYKSDFESFPQFYEFLDKNIKTITKLLLDGYEYILENGVLHNLYGPSTLKYNDGSSYLPESISKRFYIKGRQVFNYISDIRGCIKMDDFENCEIFYLTILTDVKSRRKEGVDYTREIIDLKKLRELDKRKKKLGRIVDEM